MSENGSRCLRMTANWNMRWNELKSNVFFPESEMCDQTHSFWDDFSHVMSGSRYLLPLAVDIYCHCPCLQLKFQGAWPATKIGSFLKYVFTFKIMISFKKTIVFGSPWSLETLDNLPDWSIDFSKWAKNTETVKFWVPTSKPDNLWFCLDNLNCPYFLSTKSFLDTLLKKKVVRHWCEHLIFHKVTFLDTFWREFHWFCLGWTRILMVLF